MYNVSIEGYRSQEAGQTFSAGYSGKEAKRAKDRIGGIVHHGYEAVEILFEGV